MAAVQAEIVFSGLQEVDDIKNWAWILLGGSHRLDNFKLPYLRQSVEELGAEVGYKRSNHQVCLTLHLITGLRFLAGYLSSLSRC